MVSYVKQTWTDGVSQVNAARLGKIEDGIAAAQSTADSAVSGALTIGTTGSTAKAGNYQPASTDITDATATGRAVLTAADQASARAAIGVGSSSLALGTTTTTAIANPPTPVTVLDVFRYTDPAVARPSVASNVSLWWIGPAQAGGQAPVNFDGTKDIWAQALA